MNLFRPSFSWYNLIRFPVSCGIFPESELPCNCQIQRLSSAPALGLREPVNLFSARSRVLRLLQLKKSFGILPESEVLPNEMNVQFCKFPNPVGSSPEKFLKDILALNNRVQFVMLIGMGPLKELF